jgi:hypothetical protein
LENASEEFLQANRNYAEASRDIEAVQAGRQATTRGRSEDTILAYQALRPEAKAAYRSYVDPLIAQKRRGLAFPQLSLLRHPVPLSEASRTLIALDLTGAPASCGRKM